MDLIVVESPTKAKTLSRFLGGDFLVDATMGHVKDLPKSKLGVDVENNFKPDYELVTKRSATISEIKKDAKKVKRIFLASDPDREGEAISEHVKEILEGIKKPVERITFHEITKEAVEDAIANPREIDKNLVDAQISRRVLDRLVGYKLSPLLWRKIRRGLSAGRVQSVAVRLIVEREKEIENFKPQEYWEIYVTLEPKSGKEKDKFQVFLVKIGEKKAEVTNKQTADKIVTDLKSSSYKVLNVEKSLVNKNPYPPFTTSTMSQAASRIYGFSAKRTMSIAQRLYEEGVITYHRTDSTNISIQAIEKVRAFIKKEYGEKYIPKTPRFYKTQSKVAQEAHEAIRPTNPTRKPEGKGSDMDKLYDLIWRRFVACQMSSSLYDETTIDVEAAKEKSVYGLRASGQVMKFDGWRKVSGGTTEEEVNLPEVTKDEQLKFIDVNPNQKFTEPPARFNEASLIKILEKLGIGRPSTYAPIITTIQVRNYVEKDEGKFKPTPIGVAVNDFLVKNFPTEVDYAFTAGMEDDLDEIANGRKKWEDVIGRFWKPFEKKLKDVTKTSKRVKIEVEKLGKKCPECKVGELVVRIGRFGKFISCSRFPECKYTEKYIEKVGIKCPECKVGDIVVKKSGRGRKFFGCSRYPDCKWASWRKPDTLEKIREKAA